MKELKIEKNGEIVKNYLLLDEEDKIIKIIKIIKIDYDNYKSNILLNPDFLFGNNGQYYFENMRNYKIKNYLDNLLTSIIKLIDISPLYKVFYYYYFIK